MNEVFEEAMEDLAKALQTMVDSMKELFGQLQEYAAEKKDTRERYYEREKLIPPRVVSHARSPVVRRWWINYRARDKLPLHKPENVSKWRIRKCRKKNGVSLIQPSR